MKLSLFVDRDGESSVEFSDVLGRGYNKVQLGSTIIPSSGSLDKEVQLQ